MLYGVNGEARGGRHYAPGDGALKGPQNKKLLDNFNFFEWKGTEVR